MKKLLTFLTVMAVSLVISAGSCWAISDLPVDCVVNEVSSGTLSSTTGISLSANPGGSSAANTDRSITYASNTAGTLSLNALVDAVPTGGTLTLNTVDLTTAPQSIDTGGGTATLSFVFTANGGATAGTDAVTVSFTLTTS